MSRLPSYKTRDKQIHAFGCRQRIVRAAAAVADELATKAILTRPEAQLLDAVQEYRREHPAHSRFPQTQESKAMRRQYEIELSHSDGVHSGFYIVNAETIDGAIQHAKGKALEHTGIGRGWRCTKLQERSVQQHKPESP